MGSSSIDKGKEEASTEEGPKKLSENGWKAPLSKNTGIFPILFPDFNQSFKSLTFVFPKKIFELPIRLKVQLQSITRTRRSVITGALSVEQSQYFMSLSMVQFISCKAPCVRVIFGLNGDSLWSLGCPTIDSRHTQVTHSLTC